MPSDSHRKLSINGLVAALQTVEAGPDYFNTFSGDRVAVAAKTSRPAQASLGKPVSLRVLPGDERLNIRRTASPKFGESSLLLQVHVMVKGDQAGERVVDTLEDAIHDVYLCIGKNPTLGGACSDTNLEGCSTPLYDFANSFATAVVDVRVLYDFTPGVST